MAGLPGTGKSTLARALARELGAVVLDKDRIRAALFPPAVIDYSAAQNDFCMAVVYRTAAFLLGQAAARPVIVDGRTFGRSIQVQALQKAAQTMAARLYIVECVCAEATALARLAGDVAQGAHPAADRGPALYARIKVGWVPITAPKLVVDTDAPLENCLARCLTYLTISSS